MSTFEVWREDFGETREDAKKVAALDARSAAERMCERKFSDWDYPSEIEDLCVAEVGSLEVQRFDVEVRSVPEFAARPSQPRNGRGRG